MCMEHVPGTSGTYGAVFGNRTSSKACRPTLTIVGDGEQTRDFTYVSDVADAVVAAAENKIIKEVLNIGSGKTVSVNTIAKLIGMEPFIYLSDRANLTVPSRISEKQSRF